MVRGSS